MRLSICISCGEIKKGSARKCKQCGFKPVTNEEKAKSIILSSDGEIDGEYMGKTLDELGVIRDEIRRGNSYYFNKLEVESTIDYANKGLSILPSKLVLEFIKWPTLPVLILILVFFLF